MADTDRNALRFGEFRFEADSGQLTGPAGKRILRPQAARLLEALLRQPGVLVDRESLARAVWGEGRVVEFDAGLAALIKELRAALGDSASAPRFLETVPRRGVRWLVTPTVAAAGDDADTRTGRKQRTLWLMGIAGGLLLAAFIATLLMTDSDPGEPAPEASRPPVPRVAVLPFLSISDDDRGQRTSLLLADSVIAALASTAQPPRGKVETAEPPFAVIGRTSISDYPAGEALLPALARDLAVDLVVEGSYRQEETNWLVTVSVVRVDTQTILLSRRFLVSELSSPAMREHLGEFAIEMAAAVRRCGRDCLVGRGQGGP